MKKGKVKKCYGNDSLAPHFEMRLLITVLKAVPFASSVRWFRRLSEVIFEFERPENMNVRI